MNTKENVIKKVRQAIEPIPENARHNFFIAGGALTSLFSFKPVNDIDIFCYTPADYSATKFIFDARFVKTHESSSAIRYGVNSFWRRFDYHLSKNCYTPGDVLRKFDFTICAVCYIPLENIIISHSLFEEHIRNSIFMLNTSGEPLALSYHRLEKYKDRGYKFIGPKKICIKCKFKYNCLTGDNLSRCSYGYPKI